MKRREFITLLGSAMGWPAMAQAEQTLPVIGFLHQGSAEPLPNTNAFKKGLSQSGMDNQALKIEDRAANGNYDRLPELAAELVRAR